MNVDGIIGSVLAMHEFRRDIGADVKSVVKPIHRRKHVRGESLAVVIREIPDAPRQFPFARTAVHLRSGHVPHFAVKIERIVVNLITQLRKIGPFVQRYKILENHVLSLKSVGPIAGD